MRKKSLRWLGVGISSAASLLASHSGHAKMADLPKGDKKSSQLSFGGDVGWLPWSGEYQKALGNAATQYPWKYGIVTTTFWIGEKPTQNNPVPNHKSCWDSSWAENYGGTDTPAKDQRTPEFTPKKFIPRQNPFYVALPYNDMTMKGLKPEVAKVIPWYSSSFKGDHVSVCKSRWIAIRYKGKTCYAQWEDAGPFRTDHWQYVFGDERPKPNLNKGAGLDVSPAVRDFLGMDDTDMTDWKFVEFQDVPNGPWAAFGDNNTFVQNRRAQQEGVAVADLETGKKGAPTNR